METSSPDTAISPKPLVPRLLNASAIVALGAGVAHLLLGMSALSGPGTRPRVGQFLFGILWCSGALGLARSRVVSVGACFLIGLLLISVDSDLQSGTLHKASRLFNEFTLFTRASQVANVRLGPDVVRMHSFVPLPLIPEVTVMARLKDGSLRRQVVHVPDKDMPRAGDRVVLVLRQNGKMDVFRVCAADFDELLVQMGAEHE